MNNNWQPLESNPDQLTKLIERFQPGCQFGFTDIYSLDDTEILFPFEVEAVLMLYPLDESDKVNPSNTISTPPSSFPFFLRQLVGNACGSIAVLHALLNSPAALSSGKSAESIVKLQSITTSAHDRGSYFASDPFFQQCHSACVDGTDTNAVTAADMDTMLHFVCFVRSSSRGDGGCVYELDGRYDGPIRHEVNADLGLLAGASTLIKELIAAKRGQLQFTVMALVHKDNIMDD